MLSHEQGSSDWAIDLFWLGETLEFDWIYVLLLLPLLLPTTTVDSHTIIDPLESNFWVEECKETEAGMSLFWVFFLQVTS